jgi:inosose dehydratase
MLRLGYHPATWGGRLEALWKSLPCVSRCGWDGLEYCYDDIAQWYDRPGEFRQKLDEWKLSLAGLYISSGFRDAEEVSEHYARVVAAAGFCAAVGCDSVLLDGGARNDRGHYSEADFRRVADAANRCGEVCRARGLWCSWHQHWGTMFECQQPFDRLMAMTDPDLVLCTPDTAQLSLGDFDVVATVRRYADRIRYIHFKDLGPDRRFIELGRGTVDLPGAWQALGAARYDGWIVVDLDYTSLDPEESCRANKSYLNDALGIRGERDHSAGAGAIRNAKG